MTMVEHTLRAAEKPGVVHTRVHASRASLRVPVRRRTTQAIDHSGDVYHGVPHDGDLNVQSIFKGRDTALQLATQAVISSSFRCWRTTPAGFFLRRRRKIRAVGRGALLIGVLPTSGMTISWTGFARGNKEAAIKMVVFGLILGALAAPVYTKVFMGTAIEVDMFHMFRQIVLFVFVPLAVGLVTQYWGAKKFGLQEWNVRIKPKFPPSPPWASP
jgi:ACR3 family arsenite transporter